MRKLHKAILIVTLAIGLVLGIPGSAFASTVTPNNIPATATNPGFIGEQTVSSTITWVQATISVPTSVNAITNSWVMASNGSSTWSQIGWTNNGQGGAKLFTQSWDGSTLSTHYWGVVTGSITVGVECIPGTNYFFNFLYTTGGPTGLGHPNGAYWKNLDWFSIPGQVCESNNLWSVEEETHAPIPVSFTSVLSVDSGVGVYWPNLQVG